MPDRDLEDLLALYRRLRYCGISRSTAWALAYQHITDQPKETA